MFDQLIGIVRNTFLESIRQPIALVILAAVTLMLVLANPLSSFTMEDDQRMLIDMGLATVFLAGALLSAFVATGVLTREIDNRTVLTVISKPVGRPLFVIGKFIGVAAALLVATAAMAFVFMLVELHSVLQTSRQPVHVPVVVFGVGAVLLGTAVGVWCNYFYGKVFGSTVILVTTPLLLLAYVLSLLFSHDFTPQPIGTDFKPQLWLALTPLAMAILVLTAIALAASARLNQVMTLVVTLATFLLGLLADWLVGRRIEALRSVWLERAAAEGLTREEELVRQFTLVSGEVQTAPVAELVTVAEVPLTQMAQGTEMLQYGAWWTAYSLLPNFQVLWLSDALTQSRLIPTDYVLTSVVYGMLYTVGFVALAIVLFQRREVG